MALPKFLMILPLLRQLNEVNNQALVNAQEMYDPELSPLLKEVLPKCGNDSRASLSADRVEGPKADIKSKAL